MDDLQAEIDSLGWDLDVHILGINGIGFESGNPNIPVVSDLPWLQDIAAVRVWYWWDVTYRDIVILDKDNVRVATFNVTTSNLSLPANYDTLKALLASFANHGK